MLIEKKIDLYEYFGLKRQDGCKGYINSYILPNSLEYCPDRKRPAMIVFPGGGYWMRSDREGEPIALSYSAQGFQTFVVEYTVKSEFEGARFPIMLIEACMAVAYVRLNADKYNIISDKIAVIGFSAGGHLAGSALTMYDDIAVVNALKDNAKYCRPDLGVLSYPVATFLLPTHAGTRDIACAHDASLYPVYALENRVTENTPPTFIWTTAEDSAVPCVSSLILAQALAEKKVPFELHVYQKGYHGLSLAIDETYCKNADRYDEVGEWFKKSVEFLKRNGCVPIN